MLSVGYVRPSEYNIYVQSYTVATRQSHIHLNKVLTVHI